MPDPQALRSRLTGDAGPVRVTLCSENGDPLQGLSWALPRPKVAKKAADKQVAGRPPKAVSNSSDDSSVSERIEERIVELGDWRGERLAEIRRLIHEVDPDVVEDWKWRGTPVWSHEGMYANAFKDKVKLTFFHGAELPDPNSLFNAGRREQVAGNRLPRGR